jgi:hypothetical protein
MKRVLACVALILGGCSSKSKIEPAAYVDGPFMAYRTCMHKAADAYEASKASAYEIADAAHGACGHEHMRYQLAVENYLIDTMPRSVGPDAIRREARQRADDARLRMQRFVVKKVLDVRVAR